MNQRAANQPWTIISILVILSILGVLGLMIWGCIALNDYLKPSKRGTTFTGITGITGTTTTTVDNILHSNTTAPTMLATTASNFSLQDIVFGNSTENRNVINQTLTLNKDSEFATLKLDHAQLSLNGFTLRVKKLIIIQSQVLAGNQKNASEGTFLQPTREMSSIVSNPSQHRDYDVIFAESITTDNGEIHTRESNKGFLLVSRTIGSPRPRVFGSNAYQV